MSYYRFVKLLIICIALTILSIMVAFSMSMADKPEYEECKIVATSGVALWDIWQDNAPSMKWEEFTYKVKKLNDKKSWTLAEGETIKVKGINGGSN